MSRKPFPHTDSVFIYNGRRYLGSIKISMDLNTEGAFQDTYSATMEDGTKLGHFTSQDAARSAILKADQEGGQS